MIFIYRRDAEATEKNKKIRGFLPQTTLSEVAYRLARQGGPTAVSTLLEPLPTTKIRVMALTDTDLTQTAMILRQYANSRIDFVDATIMVVAERTQRITVFYDFVLNKKQMELGMTANLTDLLEDIRVVVDNKGNKTAVQIEWMVWEKLLDLLQTVDFSDKDALMDNPMALAALYQESATEDKFLVEVGLSHYAEMLTKEDVAQRNEVRFT